MTSTRNLNTTNNYKCEKKMNENLLGYLTNTIYGEQKSHVNMFNLGSNPSKMDGSNLSHNHIDIESKLRGINSTNLVGSSFNPELSKKSFSTTELFNNHLKENVLVPRPFFHNQDERSGMHNI